MKTHNFDQAPRIAQATALFVGATRYRGPLAMVHVARHWWQMVRTMKKMPGYCRHFVYYDFPFTLGTIAFFEDMDSMMKFARSKVHRDLMIWVTDDTKNATGGYIRLFNAQPEGYSNGVWRAEDNTMQHIEYFTPLAGEKRPSKVNPSSGSLLPGAQGQPNGPARRQPRHQGADGDEQREETE